MNEDEINAFLSQPHTAVLSTLGAGGRIHAVPVWYRWDGAVFRIFTGRNSAKHRNALRTGRATLCVDQRHGGFRYVTAEGRVEVEATVTREQQLDLWTHYMGERGRAAMEAYGATPAENVCLVLTPEHWIAPANV